MFELLILNFMGLAYLIVHEGAHLLLMLHYKVEIKKVTVGYPPIVKFEYKGVPIRLGLLSMGWINPNLDELNCHPWHERLWIALAGPVASIVSGLLVLLLGAGLSPANPFPACFFQRSCGVAFGQFEQAIALLYAHGGLLSLLAGFGAGSLIYAVINVVVLVPPSDGTKIVVSLIEGTTGIRIPEGLQLVYMLVVWIVIGIYFVRNYAYIASIPLF